MARRRSKSADQSLFDDDAKGNGRGGGSSSGGGHARTQGDDDEQPVALRDIARSRYLNYALSVITSRALPDVRDGLKPVQRRILYTMWQQRITADAKHRKCAKVIGDVMGNYHPHGDVAIYDALARMAQSFTMRAPLIEGSGNFGSLDGDPPAAMRYTECRLAPIASELLSEINQDTVHFRANYDGSTTEPVVLPAKLPNLLINGTTGIAVGMATSIPPHNPDEVCQALLRLLDNPELTSAQLARTIKGPDFPTGGQIISDSATLRDIYKTGHGSFKLRATWEKGPVASTSGGGGRGSKTIHITSIPYSVNKSQLVERIGELIVQRKMPLLLDVKDLSTDDVRIALELKKDADEQKVLAYLYKNTPLQTNVNVNLTCLLPTQNAEVGKPERCDLREILQSFLQFRLDVVTHRLRHELDALEKRIHLLEGFAFAFDVLDDLIKIIRRSDGKQDAAKKIYKKYGVENYGEGGLDAQQIDAILELRLYRLARLEIQVIHDELEQKQTRAAEIRGLLDEEEAVGRWNIVRDELEALRKDYAKPDKRRTIIEETAEEPEFERDELIVAEDNDVLVTADGWVKRQKEIKDPANTRLREGDRVLACETGSTRATIAFFSNFGAAYTCRIVDIPATTGHGQPIQKLFKLKDGERIVAAFSLDPRVVGDISEDENGEYYPETYALAVSSDGYALRFGLANFVEPSTRNGRRFARPSKGSEIVGVQKLRGDQHETVIVATRQARALLCAADEINYLASAGKGVTLIKLGKDTAGGSGGDSVLGFKAVNDERDTLTVKTSMGGEQRINTAKYEIASRGGKGREIVKRGKLTEIVPEAPTAAPALEERE